MTTHPDPLVQAIRAKITDLPEVEAWRRARILASKRRWAARHKETMTEYKHARRRDPVIYGKELAQQRERRVRLAVAKKNSATLE